MSKEKTAKYFLFPSLKFNVYLTELFDTHCSITVYIRYTIRSYIYIYDFNDTNQNIFKVNSCVSQ